MLKAICGEAAVSAFATLTIALAGLSAAGATLNDGLAVYLPFNGDMANKSTSGVAVQAAPEPSATCATIVNNGFVGQCLDITTTATSNCPAPTPVRWHIRTTRPSPPFSG